MKSFILSINVKNIIFHNFYFNKINSPHYRTWENFPCKKLSVFKNIVQLLTKIFSCKKNISHIKSLKLTHRLSMTLNIISLNALLTSCLTALFKQLDLFWDTFHRTLRKTTELEAYPHYRVTVNTTDWIDKSESISESGRKG